MDDRNHLETLNPVKASSDHGPDKNSGPLHIEPSPHDGGILGLMEKKMETTI